MKKAIDQQRRESYAGFHFWNLYNNCRWKFYVRYVLGLKPFFTKPPLIFGGAFHEGKRTFYSKQSAHSATTAFKREMEDRQDEYQYQDKWLTDWKRGQLLLTAWINKYGKKDLRFYEVLLVEEELNVPLPNGYIMTIRPDAILKSIPTEIPYVFETKTTGFSVTVAAAGVRSGDQATSYLYGTRKLFPHWNIEGVVTDIAYQNQSVIKCERPDVVYRTIKDLHEFEIGTVGIMAEISQKIRALQSWEPASLFGRNTEWCTSYFSPCEYTDICRIKNLTDVPPKGFLSDPWVDYDTIVNLDYDLLDRIEVQIK